MGKRSVRVIGTLATAFTVWAALVLGYLPAVSSMFDPTVLNLLPLIVLFVFGVYSAFTVLYGVATFPECPEAYEELQQQIKEAKEELSKKGLKFKD